MRCGIFATAEFNALEGMPNTADVDLPGRAGTAA
jgi:hypothetical protein